MKEKIRNLRDTLKDPRKKALFKLGCWFAFFFILYVVILLMPKRPYHYTSSSIMKSDTIHNFRKMNSFEYTYTFFYQGTEEKMVGTYFDKNYYFTYLEQEYYMTEENIYRVDTIHKTLLPESSFILSLVFRELNQNTIADFITNGTLVEEKTYKDGKKISKYQYLIEDGKSIYLTVTEKDYYIHEILVDLKEYLETKMMVYDTFQVKLEYSEMDNLNSYSKDYVDYQVLIEGE